MNPELEFIAKYAPALGVLIATVMLIAYTKKSLFQDVISKEMFQAQLEREREFVTSTKEAAGHLDEIGRQLEGIARKQSEDVHEQTIMLKELLSNVADRLHTLELVFSDHIDVIRELSSQWEKYRKNIPDTEVFLAKRKEKQA